MNVQIYKNLHISENKYMLIFLITMFFVWSGSGIYAQNINFENIKKSEEKLFVLFSDLNNAHTDTIKEQLTHEIVRELEKTLQLRESFDYSFDLLKNLSVLTSSDKKMRVYTWNVVNAEANQKYFGFVQYRNKAIFKLTTLIDDSENIQNPEMQLLNPNQWYGALYYEIIATSEKKNTYYTVLGWDGGDLFVNRKVIDIIVVSNNGTPKFGGSIQIKNKKIRRMIFEYNNKATMTLRYEQNAKMLVFDHLSPSDPKYKGQTRFYGPDFSYDGLFFKDGQWNYSPDIDVRNPKEKANNREIIRDN